MGADSTVLERDLHLIARERKLANAAQAWLPDRIFDAHAHNYLAEHVFEVPDRARRHIINTYPEFSVAQSRVLHRYLFGAREVRALRFSYAMPGVDFKAVNDWLPTALGPDDRFALFGLQDDIEYTLERLRVRPAALKQYYFVTDPPGAKIYDVFPPRVLEACQDLAVPIILHLPKPLTESIQDLLSVISSFPRLLIVLAHAGVDLVYSPRLDEAFAALVAYEAVYFDTALVDDVRILQSLFAKVGTDRVCFGTDEPLHLIRANTYIHPHLGPRLAPRKPYNWTDPEEYAQFGKCGQGAVHWHWAALSALRDALPSRHRDRALQDVFYDTAATIYSGRH